MLENTSPRKRLDILDRICEPASHREALHETHSCSTALSSQPDVWCVKPYCAAYFVTEFIFAVVINLIVMGIVIVMEIMYKEERLEKVAQFKYFFFFFSAHERRLMGRIANVVLNTKRGTKSTNKHFPNKPSDIIESLPTELD